MSTVRRRRANSLCIDLPNGHSEDLPPVAAVFLILFDVKAGYTIAWKRSVPGLELNESVEFKSLPSGLHKVQEDLVYFIHDNDYAGISAFINEPAEESDRNALMLAVGALLPLSYGRLGKSWKHAVGLKELAKTLAQDPSKTQPLEEFWMTNKFQNEDDSQNQATQVDSPSADRAKGKQGQASPNGQRHTRKRAVTAASALAPPGQSLSSHHPALSLPAFVDTFGPLIFPLYKAALLRKRILLVGQAPVEMACNFVYNISVLSGIPSSVSGFLPLDPLPTRLHTLFEIGVHDMPTLAQGSRNSKPGSDLIDDDRGYGWVACTTDDILSWKDHLYDTLITLPPSYSKQAKEKVWPRVEIKKGTAIKATQRDLRRYRILRRGLRRFPGNRSPSSKQSNGTTSTGNIPFENTQETYDDASSTLNAQLAEPQSWSALAYSSFMWWASAGEKRTDLDEEEEYDAALLHHFDSYGDESPNRPRSAGRSPGRSLGMQGGMDSAPAGFEMTIIAYFHRLTTLILKTLSDVVDSSDYSDTDGEATANGEQERLKSRDEGREEAGAVFVSNEDMTRMGLDVWSESDREFVRELVAFYWGRKADVRSGRVECCGVRIC